MTLGVSDAFGCTRGGRGLVVHIEGQRIALQRHRKYFAVVLPVHSAAQQKSPRVGHAEVQQHAAFGIAQQNVGANPMSRRQRSQRCFFWRRFDRRKCHRWTLGLRECRRAGKDQRGDDQAKWVPTSTQAHFFLLLQKTSSSFKFQVNSGLREGLYFCLDCQFYCKGTIPCLLLPLPLPARTTPVFSMN